MACLRFHLACDHFHPACLILDQACHLTDPPCSLTETVLLPGTSQPILVAFLQALPAFAPGSPGVSSSSGGFSPGSNPVAPASGSFSPGGGTARPSSSSPSASDDQRAAAHTARVQLGLRPGRGKRGIRHPQREALKHRGAAHARLRAHRTLADGYAPRDAIRHWGVRVRV